MFFLFFVIIHPHNNFIYSLLNTYLLLDTVTLNSQHIYNKNFLQHSNTKLALYRILVIIEKTLKGVKLHDITPLSLGSHIVCNTIFNPGRPLPAIDFVNLNPRNNKVPLTRKFCKFCWKNSLRIFVGYYFLDLILSETRNIFVMS